MANSTETVRRATIGIALLVLTSKVIGFLREAVIAYRFGTGREYDIYLIAISIPIALYSLFSYSMSNIFIPAYARAVADPDKESALGKVWNEFIWSLILAVVAMAAIIAFAPHIISAIAPGLDRAFLPEAVLIIRISSVIIIFAALESFFRSILNAEKKFYIPASGPIFANLIIITFILSLSSDLSTRAILYGMVCGFAVQVLINYGPFHRLGLWKYFSARLNLKKCGGFFIPAVAVLIVEGSAQVYSLVDRYFASAMDPGIISALGYSYILIQLPASIFAYALSTALFPYMSDAFAGHDDRRGSQLLSRGLKISLLMAIPATILFWVFSDAIVALFFRRGAFDSVSVDYTAAVLKYQALGLTGHFLLWILTRAYYAAGRMRLLLGQVVIAISAKIIISAVIVERLGYIGLALTSSISFTLASLILIIGIPFTMGNLDIKKAATYFIKLAISGAGAWCIAWYIGATMIDGAMTFWPLLGDMIIAAGATLVGFLLIGYGLKLDEIRNLWPDKKVSDD